MTIGKGFAASLGPYSIGSSETTSVGTGKRSGVLGIVSSTRSGIEIGLHSSSSVFVRLKNRYE